LGHDSIGFAAHCRVRYALPGAPRTARPEEGSTIMKNGLLIVVGAVITIVGAFWALQGFGVVGGSFMSNNHTYEIVGPVVALVGLAVALYGLRRRGSVSHR